MVVLNGSPKHFSTSHLQNSFQSREHGLFYTQHHLHTHRITHMVFSSWDYRGPPHLLSLKCSSLSPRHRCLLIYSTLNKENHNSTEQKDNTQRKRPVPKYPRRHSFFYVLNGKAFFCMLGYAMQCSLRQAYSVYS